LRGLDLRLRLRLDLRLDLRDLRLDLRDLRLDLRLRLERLRFGPGLRLHTLDPFLIPREHLRLERLERLDERLERLGPGLALQPCLADFLRPYLHGLLDFLLLLVLGMFFYYLKENNKKLKFKL